MLCDEYERLKSSIRSIADKTESPSINLYSDEQKEYLKHDLTQAREIIFQWKSHIIRAENQERAKQNVLSSLQVNYVLIVIDWAMKFLQMKYREKAIRMVREKRNQLACKLCYIKNAADDSLQIQSYVHLFYSCA